MTSFAQAAVDALLDPNPDRREHRLNLLVTLVDRTINGGECPECGTTGPHEDNGDSIDPLFLCRTCGMCFTPGEGS